MSNASGVSISFGAVKYGKDERGYFKAVSGLGLSRGPNKKAKKFEIRLYYDKKAGYIPENLRGDKYVGPQKAPPFTVKSKAWVSCSCEYFLYHAEVADASTGSSSVRYSNGARPKITNPGMVGHLCKHLISAARKGALVKK